MKKLIKDAFLEPLAFCTLWLAIWFCVCLPEMQKRVGSLSPSDIFLIGFYGIGSFYLAYKIYKRLEK